MSKKPSKYARKILEYARELLEYAFKPMEYAQNVPEKLFKYAPNIEKRVSISSC